ncbi:2-oxoglutarate dehydrogenase complex dihydrolipoyllysine-residue succinyltransferase [Pontibacter sp. G13]|uniref:2-oxoglutarate dehydrogenase complex dihydrolipoyllysine-residue succinyltransferase n=1 Tax=Pontibacter sp. G13 TaxID=3074898 RepID=UPI00288BF455|nr:2-oxoglutarate dehydrogenase complex dihydrolipoyllysine-residue succinyltransferase [Pontibacter sp. G13]WNJ21254.1 2-oxoglutarate dehydrogenase complex dihydrolipoyllysine-residue succinyltransferase [Pontibacter sp. G13]
MVIEVKVPSPGESITEVEIESWLVESGTFVEMDAELAEINSDKATLTVNAEQGGVIEILVEEGETVEVGQTIAKIDTAAEGAATSDAAAPAKTVDAPVETAALVTQGTGFAAGHPSPSAEKMMKEKGINPADVQGSGRDGRVTKTDVVNAKPAAKAAPAPAPKAEPKKEARPLPGLPTLSGGTERVQRREKMSSLRRKIADRLVSVKNETAMLTTFNEVDLSEVMAIRKKYKEQFKEHHGVGLGFMSFFTKAVTMALKDFPGVNAQIDGKEIVYHDYADIGIAVSSERGLVVPVIRDAHLMSLAQMEQSVLHYALKARANKITVEDMTGGTFTITNGGVFGSMLSTPIINPPQSAILGMHNIVQRPVAVNGEVKIRPIMYVALSYDHRIIDGKEAVSFLFKVKERLEDPSRMLLEI